MGGHKSAIQNIAHNLKVVLQNWRKNITMTREKDLFLPGTEPVDGRKTA